MFLYQVHYYWKPFPHGRREAPREFPNFITTISADCKIPKDPHHTTTVVLRLFPWPPGWDGARRELLDFMVQGKINRGRHTNHPDGRHSIRPTNSVNALKAPKIIFPDFSRPCAALDVEVSAVTTVSHSLTAVRRHLCYASHSSGWTTASAPTLKETVDVGFSARSSSLSCCKPTMLSIFSVAFTASTNPSNPRLIVAIIDVNGLSFSLTFYRCSDSPRFSLTNEIPTLFFPVFTDL